MKLVAVTKDKTITFTTWFIFTYENDKVRGDKQEYNERRSFLTCLQLRIFSNLKY